MPESLRLFIGIDVGDAWTERLSATADGLRDSLGRTVRWVRPELYHVTLIFLGDQSPDDVSEIESALAAAASPLQPFRLHLTELQLLGRHERGALIAGVDDPDRRLQRLNQRLYIELRERYIKVDSRSLVPHVTLGRPRGRSGSIPLAPLDLHDAPSLTVRAVNLVKSDLLPAGPRYETIATVHFDEQIRPARELK
jgi:RNA 2',3'-cyclic 3'-phosphodiesterase